MRRHLLVHRPEHSDGRDPVLSRAPRSHLNPLAWALLSVCAACTIATGAEAVRIPSVARLERGAYRARDTDTGSELWRHEWTVKRQTQGEVTVLRASQHGSGRRGRPEPTAWVGHLHAILGREGYRLSSRREIRDAQGHLLETEERELDTTAGTGRITLVAAPSSRVTLRRVRLTPDALDIEMLPVELRRLPAIEGQRMRFELVTEEGKTVDMEAAIVGRETVEVPAGLFACHRIELRVAGALGAAARLFLPAFSMWHTVAPPHFWIKYRGPAGGVRSPEILRELTRFERIGE